MTAPVLDRPDVAEAGEPLAAPVAGWEDRRPVEAPPVPRARRSARSQSLAARAATVESRTWMRALACAFVVVLVTSVAIEPAPNGPQPATPWWDAVAAILLLVLYPTAVISLIRGASWAPRAALGAAGVILAGVVACPASGHHLIGAWWVAELAMWVGVTGASAALTSRMRATAP